MKNRLSGGLHHGSGFLTVFMTVLLMFCTAYPVYGATVDLLDLPAEKSDRASSYMLTDVVNVNGRMVAVGERGHILYTDDEKCEVWLQADVPVSLTLTSVYFPTDEKGWAVGHDGIVLHTKDSGKTWEKQLDGVKINKLMLEQVKFLIKTHKLGKVLKKKKRHHSESSIDQLMPPVEDWSFFLSDIEMAVREGPTWPLMDVWFKNDQEGFVIGSFGMILRTTDGGKTWEPRLDTIDNLDGFHYYAITRSGNDLFIVGESGMLFRSEDYGLTWQRLESPYEGSYFGITGDPDGGFVAGFGMRGNIFYSLDRGNTWKQSNTGKKASLLGGVFLSDGSLCLVGIDGTILLSRDKGKTFAPLKKNFPGGISLTQVKRGALAVVGMRGVTRIDFKK
jgi:photosystem II stability/assembly factor-like uncharacterized protein